MLEVWHGDDYIILFAGEEALAMADGCEINAMLPGFSVLGLRGWQDFIVQEKAGATFTIPSVPLDTRYIASFNLPDPFDLEPDTRLAGKVKWLVKPLVFGGSPDAEDNVSWVTHQQHGDLVRWWNEQYRSAKASQALWHDRLNRAMAVVHWDFGIEAIAGHFHPCLKNSARCGRHGQLRSARSALRLTLQKESVLWVLGSGNS